MLFRKNLNRSGRRDQFLIKYAVGLTQGARTCTQAVNRDRVLLHLTAVDLQNNFHDFSCYIDGLESSFDVLNRIVSRGDKLISAQLIDGQNVIDLPIEAFDGDSMMELIKELESEWKSVLEEPSLARTKILAALLIMTNKQLAVCEGQIVRIDPLLSRVKSLLLRSQKMNIPVDARQALENNYQHTLSLYQRQLDRAYLTRQRLLQTIDSLS